jgi:Na+-translocating ferredoxin:NAD+ oxidoreductase RnfC subunit
MNAPLNILAALASYGVKAVIENGRVRLVCPKDNPPPAELVEAARAHKGELHQLLATQEARCNRFEERAAILEFDEGLSRAEAEAIARREMMAGVYDDMQAARDSISDTAALAALRAECPAYVDAADWQQVIADGHRFHPVG